MSIVRWGALLLLVLLAGCISNKVFLITRDDQDISYHYHENGWKGVILLHQLDGSMEDWTVIEKALQEEGFSYIKIDFRGHGESSGDWQLFSEEDFNSMTYDVEAAHKFMKVKGVNTIAIIGASIGANVATKYALWREVENLVLLSPGFNYRGVDITDDIASYTGDVMVLTGKDDSYAYTTAKVFQRDLNASIRTVKSASHGIQLLPGMNAHIISFLRQA